MTDLVGAPSRPRRDGEDGVGVVSSVFGVMAFLGFVLVTVQVVLYMFTASVVQTAALDGATHGAAADSGAPVAAARGRAQAVLGGMSTGATITGAVRDDPSGQVLRLTVRVQSPTMLVRGLGLSTIERSADARIEQ